MTKSKGTQKNYSEDYSLDSAKNEISNLTYKEALDCLDEILDLLQKDDVPVESIQKYYEKGNLYLEHCEMLLKKIEQEVIIVEAKK